MIWWLPLALAAANGGRHAARGDSGKEIAKGTALGGVAGLGLGSLIGGGAAAGAGAAGSGASSGVAGSAQAAASTALHEGAHAGLAASGAGAGAAGASTAGTTAAASTPWLQSAATGAGKQAITSTAMQQLQPEVRTKTPTGGLPEMQKPSAGLQFGNLTPEQLRAMGLA